MTRAQTMNPLWHWLPASTGWIFATLFFVPSHRLAWTIWVGGAMAWVVAAHMVSCTKPSRVVVVTNRRVLVWAGRTGADRKTELLRELPRATPAGPTSGKWWRSFDSLGERLHASSRRPSGNERIVRAVNLPEESGHRPRTGPSRQIYSRPLSVDRNLLSASSVALAAATRSPSDWAMPNRSPSFECERKVTITGQPRTVATLTTSTR